MAALAQARKKLPDMGFLDLPIPPGLDLKAEITRLRREKNAVILAHYYQDGAIQDLADKVADSLGLAQFAAHTTADMIVLAGVHFMAETAKILNPGKKVVLPDLKAGCSLADSCPPGPFRQWVEAHPGAAVVTYINCSAEIKAMSDIVCTSANAAAVIESIPPGRPILFAPDENLGKYLMKKTGRPLTLWPGSCLVHEAFSLDKILHLCTAHPRAKIIAHPESDEKLLRVAHFIGSTAALLNFVQKDEAREFIVATEAGILHQMQRVVPHKLLLPAPIDEEVSCACSECPYMKLNSLQKLYLCMEYEQPEALVPEATRLKALAAIQRMLEVSRRAGLTS